MKTIALAMFILLLFSCGCAKTDAFSKKRLELTADIRMENGAASVEGSTNLPDGFYLFIQVDAAPGLGGQASWAGSAKVISGSFHFETIFTEKLPYRAAVVVSGALNPGFARQFQSGQLPFSVDPQWKAAPVGDGAFQFSREFSQTFGEPAEHRAVLSKDLDELQAALTALLHEVRTLDGIVRGEPYGLARFGRLHAEKRKSLFLDAGSTSFHFPRTFESLRKLDRDVEGYYFYAIATVEKDAQEAEKHKKARERFDESSARVTREIADLKAALAIR